jgi:hypothetical protein
VTLPKKLLLVVGVLFTLTLLTLLVLPVLLRDRITERVHGEIDRAVDASVSWGSVGLTFFRDFPNLTLGLGDLEVIGTGRFEGDTLASVDHLRFVLDAPSVVRSLRQRGPIVVRSIRIEEPVLHLRVLDDGTASWDIVRPRQEEAERDERGGGEDERGGGEGERGAGEADGQGRHMAVELRGFDLSDGTVTFDNARSGLHASLVGLSHSLSGNFSRESLVATTRAHADQTTVSFAGTPYLAGVALDFRADLDLDLAEKRLTFRENELRLNDLVLGFAGEAAWPGDDVAIDLTFAAPDTEFRQVLSLVPVIYAQDFASLETGGTFSVEGSVRGAYGEDALPAFSLSATVADGTFRYPDLPLPARAISVDLSIDNPGGDVDSTVVSLSGFHVEIGDQSVDGALTLRTPLSDPDLDVRVRGALDLADVARTIKLEGVGDIGGTVTADAAVRARRSDLDSARYERVAASGGVSARNLTLDSEELRQPIVVEEMAIELSPERADLNSFRARLGSSDLEASGRLENLLGFVLRDEALRGSGTFTSRRFVLDEWKSDDELTIIPVPAMLDLTLDGTVDRLTYDELVMSDAKGSLRIQDQRLTLDGFNFATLGGRIGASGHYETTDPSRPTFGLQLAIDSVDVGGASAAFTTVRMLAPVARYARGTFSADLDLGGALARDMTPVLDVLDGSGSLLTSRIAIEGFPLIDRLSDALSLSQLTNPTFDAVRSSMRISDGRLHVEPFQAAVAGLRMTVGGSNGIDQSLDYTLGLAMPRAALGEAADRVLRDLAMRAGRAGVDASAGDSVRVGVRVGGTVADPTLDLSLGETVASARELAGQAAEAAVERRVEEARARLDEAEEEARRRAQARADSIVAEAERRADAIRAEARALADEVRAEGNRRADEVLARATNPLARRAAQPVADRIRQEADERASQIVREADERADALVVEARRRAGEGEGG